MVREGEMNGVMRWGVGPKEDGKREVRGKGGTGNERWEQREPPR